LKLAKQRYDKLYVVVDRKAYFRWGPQSAKLLGKLRAPVQEVIELLVASSNRSGIVADFQVERPFSILEPAEDVLVYRFEQIELC
jgi:hypothetical protein